MAPQPISFLPIDPLAERLGIDPSTVSPEFQASKIVDSERAKMLDRRGSYFASTQHDHKMFDFNGAPIAASPNPALQVQGLAGQPSDMYIPMRNRRPCAPYRLAKVIVDSFTNMVFGHQRWPTIRSPGDQDTEYFARALVDEGKLRTLMIRARTMGGSTGSIAISWRFIDGRPVNYVHHPKNIYVHKWMDRDRLIPAHIIEVYKYPRDEWDPRQRKLARNWYWFRRDWTPMADVAFVEQLDAAPMAESSTSPPAGRNPQWVIDLPNTYVHNDGFPHFVWGQNLPSPFPEEIDGVPDYEGLYEIFDSMDILNSVLVSGTTKNLDPTLVLKMDPDVLNAMAGTISKGSDNALTVGLAGDAHYMELQGSSIQVGKELFAKMRETALETAQCVVPDPNQIGAAGTSSVALKVVYSPMLGKTDIAREQYEEVMRRLLEQQLQSARREAEVHVEIGDDGTEVATRTIFRLPPRTEMVDEEDPNTGEVTKKEVVIDLRPGPSDRIVFDWGDYFQATAQDQQQIATTLSQLTAAQLISKEAGADQAARAIRIDPRTDWVRLQKEQKEQKAGTSVFAEDMGGDPGGGPPGGGPPPGGSGRGDADRIGGRVSGRGDLPDGALPRQKSFSVDDRDAMAARSDVRDTMTVNEMRELMGLPLLDGPDGDLTMADYQLRKRLLAQALKDAPNRD